jgi:hypothetical protein
MGEAKRRQKADPDWGKSPAPPIPGRVEQLFAQAEKLWVIEQMLTLAEEQKAKKKQAKKLARKPQTPTDKPNEPTAE